MLLVVLIVVGYSVFLLLLLVGRTLKESKLGALLGSLTSHLRTPSVGLGVVTVLLLFVFVLFLQLWALSTRVSNLEEALQDLTSLLNSTLTASANPATTTATTPAAKVEL